MYICHYWCKLCCWIEKPIDICHPLCMKYAVCKSWTRTNCHTKLYIPIWNFFRNIENPGHKICSFKCISEQNQYKYLAQNPISTNYFVNSNIFWNIIVFHTYEFINWSKCSCWCSYNVWKWLQHFLKNEQKSDLIFCIPT